jgi:hypothetical protein
MAALSQVRHRAFYHTVRVRSTAVVGSCIHACAPVVHSRSNLFSSHTVVRGPTSVAGHLQSDTCATGSVHSSPPPISLTHSNNKHSHVDVPRRSLHSMLDILEYHISRIVSLHIEGSDSWPPYRTIRSWPRYRMIRPGIIEARSLFAWVFVFQLLAQPTEENISKEMVGASCTSHRRARIFVRHYRPP